MKDNSVLRRHRRGRYLFSARGSLNLRLHVVTLVHSSQFIDSFTKSGRQMGGFSRYDIVGTKTSGFGFLLILSSGGILL